MMQTTTSRFINQDLTMLTTVSELGNRYSPMDATSMNRFPQSPQPIKGEQEEEESKVKLDQIETSQEFELLPPSSPTEQEAMVIQENENNIKKMDTLRVGKRRSDFTVNNLDEKSETEISIVRSTFGEDPANITISPMNKDPEVQIGIRRA